MDPTHSLQSEMIQSIILKLWSSCNTCVSSSTETLQPFSLRQSRKHWRIKDVILAVHSVVFTSIFLSMKTCTTPRWINQYSSCEKCPQGKNTNKLQTLACMRNGLVNALGKGFTGHMPRTKELCYPKRSKCLVNVRGWSKLALNPWPTILSDVHDEWNKGITAIKEIFVTLSV